MNQPSTTLIKDQTNRKWDDQCRVLVDLSKKEMACVCVCSTAREKAQY